MLLSATYRTPPLQEEYEIWSKFVYNLDFEGYFRGVYMVFRCIYNKSLVSSNTPMNMNRIKRIILQSNLFITFFSLHSLFNYNNTYIISFYFFILSWFQWSSGNSIIFHFNLYSLQPSRCKNMHVRAILISFLSQILEGNPSLGKLSKFPKQNLISEFPYVQLALSFPQREALIPNDSPRREGEIKRTKLFR